MCDNPDPDLFEKAKNNPRLEPFLHSFYEKDLYEKFKSYIFPGPIFTFLRLAFFFVCLFAHHISQHIVYLGYSDWDHPAPKWRRRGSHFITKFWARIGMFSCGFYRLKLIDHSKEKGSLIPFQIEQRYPLVGCHLSEIDILVLAVLMGNPSFAAKSEMWSTPLLSFLVKCFRCFKIVRKEKVADSDKKKDSGTPEKNELTSTEILVDRIKNPQPNEYTPLIFPEGTTGSGRCVLRFHRGAFVAGEPVRPFIIRYPSKHVSLSYDTNTIFKLAYDVGSQFLNRVEVELYDVYFPTEEEKQNPGLYARNVGKLIANKLGVPYHNNCDIKECHLLLDLFKKKKTYEEVEVALAELEADRIKEDGGDYNN